MIIRIEVRIETEQMDGPTMYPGGMSFQESAHLKGRTFTAVAAVFARIHDLLETVKQEFPDVNFQERKC